VFLHLVAGGERRFLPAPAASGLRVRCTPPETVFDAGVNLASDARPAC